VPISPTLSSADRAAEDGGPSILSTRSRRRRGRRPERPSSRSLPALVLFKGAVPDALEEHEDRQDNPGRRGRRPERPYSRSLPALVRFKGAVLGAEWAAL